MIELLVLPALIGCAVAITAAPLGAFVMWNRLVYFGDTLSHSALLGVAFAVLMSFNPAAGIALACVCVAILLWLLQSKTALANDSLLGIISHSALALGLVCVSLLSNTRIDLYAYLFGDLLTTTRTDLFLILCTSSLIWLALLFFWRRLLMITIDENLAQVEGLDVNKLKLVMMILIALLIGIAMKVVGILLITALLIIPCATARKLTRSPEALVFCAGLFATCSVLTGLLASYFLDTPPGASIVLSNTLFFICVQIMARTND